MRRKRRRTKPWYGRLFGAAEVLRTVFGKREEVNSVNPPAAPVSGSKAAVPAERPEKAAKSPIGSAEGQAPATSAPLDIMKAVAAAKALAGNAAPALPVARKNQTTSPAKALEMAKAVAAAKALAGKAAAAAPVPKPDSATESEQSRAQRLAAFLRRLKTGEDPADAIPQSEKTWFEIYWRKVGGGSLMVSLFIHLFLLAIGSFIVTSVVQERRVDFLPGGGSKAGVAASQELAHQVKTRKRMVLNKALPPRKIVSFSNTAAIALPDVPMNELPEMSSILGGRMASAGFSSSGAGGGFGNGMGIGGMSGRSFKPIVMFGRNLGARSIAVILDVSGSMTPHLSEVITELDRVAKGSPVVLYVGCGVAKPPEGVHIDDTAIETRRPSFRAFWQADHGPEEDVCNLMERRAFTYFIKSQGIQYAWVSLLSQEVRHAEALYWFSDFQDDVDDDQIESVLTNLKRRKQKLFMHASEEGSSFERIRDKLCLPSGGLVIESRR